MLSSTFTDLNDVFDPIDCVLARYDGRRMTNALVEEIEQALEAEIAARGLAYAKVFVFWSGGGLSITFKEGTARYATGCCLWKDTLRLTPRRARRLAA